MTHKANLSELDAAEENGDFIEVSLVRRQLQAAEELALVASAIASTHQEYAHSGAPRPCACANCQAYAKWVEANQ